MFPVTLAATGETGPFMTFLSRFLVRNIQLDSLLGYARSKDSSFHSCSEHSLIIAQLCKNIFGKSVQALECGVGGHDCIDDSFCFILVHIAFWIVRSQLFYVLVGNAPLCCSRKSVRLRDLKGRQSDGFNLIIVFE